MSDRPGRPGDQEDAEDILEALSTAYIELLEVDPAVDISDVCRELTRLIRHWGWEWTVAE